MRAAKLIKARAVVSDHRNGATVKELAKKYDLSKATIRNYIHEAEDKKKNSVAAAQRAKIQKEIKEERDNERRNTLETRTAMAEERKEKVMADIEAGMTRKEAAEKEGLSYCTITDYIRGEKIPDGLLTYRDTLRAGQTKRTLQEWAAKKTGNTIKTPEGKMIMLRAYPHIVECAKQYAKGYTIATFTLAEVYYINQGG